MSLGNAEIRMIFAAGRCCLITAAMSVPLNSGICTSRRKRSYERVTDQVKPMRLLVVQSAVNQNERGLAISAPVPEVQLQSVRIVIVGNRFH